MVLWVSVSVFSIRFGHSTVYKYSSQLTSFGCNIDTFCLVVCVLIFSSLSINIEPNVGGLKITGGARRVNSDNHLY